MTPTVLTIAGSDCSGGAGIQADIKTISALGGYAASVITAVTAQNTLGVQAVYPQPAEAVAAQLHSVFDDLRPSALKIGMLPHADIASTVVSAIRRHSGVPVVCDPVMISTSGRRLMAEDAVQVLTEQLFPLCTLITPNLHEAAFLDSLIRKNSDTTTPTRVMAAIHPAKTEQFSIERHKAVCSSSSEKKEGVSVTGKNDAGSSYLKEGEGVSVTEKNDTESSYLKESVSVTEKDNAESSYLKEGEDVNVTKKNDAEHSSSEEEKEDVSVTEKDNAACSSSEEKEKEDVNVTKKNDTEHSSSSEEKESVSVTEKNDAEHSSSEEEKEDASVTEILKGMEETARRLAHRFQTSVLVKGGHLAGEEMCDVLYDLPNDRLTRYTSRKIHSRNLHGTGCTLSSAIATYLANGCSLNEAVAQAKAYMNRAIERGKELHIGRGNGPLWHF